VAALKDKKYNYVLNEIEKVRNVCINKTLKVIIETCYLDDDEIIKACELSVKVKADYVKTSTGFGSDGAKIKDVQLMKQTVQDNAEVKASGGIKTYQDAIDMVNAGAKRIGTSHGIEIAEGGDK